jgi:undecaprenyl-diphosphatase
MNAVLAYVTASDFQVFARVLAFHPPRWVRLWMLWATRLADGWLWLATGLLLLAGGGECYRVLAATAIAAGLANGVQVVLKRKVRRKRPCDYARHPLYNVQPLGHFPSDRFSFPSGHTLNAFAIGSVIALQFPVLLPAVAAVALSVAASRVLLGLHFVSDVVAGAALGAALGAGVFHVLLG